MEKRYDRFFESEDLDELIGEFKGEYGTNLKEVLKDPKYKKLSPSDKEYVKGELKDEGFY